MPPLPDVDTASYSQYQADQFSSETDRRIGTLSFNAATTRRIADLNNLYAPPPTLPAPTPVEPTPPPVADASADAGLIAPAAVPSPAGMSPPSSGLPAPDAPLPTSFGPVVSPPAPTASSSPPVQSGGRDYVADALNTADRYSIDPQLFVSLVQQESNFDPNARSPVGAQGLTQLMPETARDLGVTNPLDPVQNLDAGARYLRQNLDRFGGDVTKALAAYNAGPGAVEQYGGIPPYKETQRYVDSILSRIQAESIDTSATTGQPGTFAPGPTEGLRRVGSGLENQQGSRDISQFGDPQLTSDEAYAACGPAAAVRFAQRFGRNPTLREATDLAKTVGWTSAQGMAGLGSEKALMDKIGVPTKLVQGPDWQTFSKEAQTGNPVTISTQGHYFTADGFNPDTGAFHVGRSGLDLKGGAEWMTPAQMTGIMGPVQGGLLADNPQIPTPSIADQDTNPLGFLGRAKDALSGSLSSLGDAIGNSQFMRNVTGTNPNEAEMQAQFDQSGVRIPSNPLELLGGSGLGAPTSGEEATNQRNQFIAENNPLRDVPVVGGASTFAAQAAADPTNLMLAGPGIGRAGVAAAREAGTALEAAAPALREFATSEEGALKLGGGAPTQPAYQSVLPQGTFEAPVPPSAPLSQQLGEARQTLFRNVTRALFDRQVDINQAQEAYARALGRPLNADEMAAELQRLSPDAAASVKIDEGLRPAIQAVGNDYNALRDYVTLRSNVQVAEGAGSKVLETGLGRDVPSNLRDDLNAANTSLRMRQDALTALQADSVPDQARIQNAQRSVNSAQRVAQRRQDAIDAWQQANTQAASTAGADVALNRKFSGGMDRDQSLQALQALEQQLGPDRFARVQQAADDVSAFGTNLRQRLVDSGVLSQDQATQLETMYPDWAKTRILDYMKDPAGGQGAGTKIGLADRQLRQYTLEGTARAREDPLASTVAYAHQVERMAMKNDAFNALRTIDQASPNPLLKQVSQDFTPTRNQVTVIGFENGQKVKYVTDNKALGQAINGTSVTALPSWVSAWQNVFKSLATSRNPAFLAGNAALDIPTYVFRSAIREGGPQQLPSILAELARGYGSAFQGLLQGEFRGSTADFLRGGGGQSGYFTDAATNTSKTIGALQRSNVFQINGPGDILRLSKDLLTLKPVEAIGERIELGPRTAAYNLAQKRGANMTQAVIDGRTVTVDFSQGGSVTKLLNQFIPFLNVGFQGPVQVARAFRDNPRAFMATAGTLVGVPSIAAEVWNRSDPQRAKDYADVPQYVKDQGVVVMLPGEVPIDKDGNRKPLYAVLKLREWAPFASIARDATARVLGDDSKSWQEVAASALQGLSPTQSTSLGQAGVEPISGIPVLPAAAQLQFNKDFFRNRDIVTQRNDQNASAAAKALTPMIQAAVDKLGLNAEIRPSAVEFFIRNQGAGVGAAALGASDIAAGTPRRDTSPTTIPGAGGLISRFVGNQTGEGMQQARQDILSPSAREILRQSGVITTPSPISGTTYGIPLRIEEETRMQNLANRYIDDAVHRVAAASDFASLPPQGKKGRMDAAIAAARSRAEGEVLSTIPQPVRQQRQRTKSAAP